MVVVAFSSLARILEECLTIHSCLRIFFFEVENSSCTLISLFRPGAVHSGSASWDNCGRMFLDESRVSSFPYRFPHYAWTEAMSAHSDFVGSRVYAYLGVTALLAEWPESFTCHCSHNHESGTLPTSSLKYKLVATIKTWMTSSI